MRVNEEDLDRPTLEEFIEEHDLTLTMREIYPDKFPRLRYVTQIENVTRSNEEGSERLVRGFGYTKQEAAKDLIKQLRCCKIYHVIEAPYITVSTTGWSDGE